MDDTHAHRIRSRTYDSPLRNLTLSPNNAVHQDVQRQQCGDRDGDSDDAGWGSGGRSAAGERKAKHQRHIEPLLGRPGYSGAGVQGFDWLVRRMREDEDGDVAEEFFHADDGTEADGALRVVRGTKAATVTQARAAAVPSPRR